MSTIPMYTRADSLVADLQALFLRTEDTTIGARISVAKARAELLRDIVRAVERLPAETRAAIDPVLEERLQQVHFEGRELARLRQEREQKDLEDGVSLFFR